MILLLQPSRKVRRILRNEYSSTNHLVASGKGGKGPLKLNEDKSSQVVSGMEAMKIDSAPKVTSKNLDVLAEYKKSQSKNSANFVVIGMLIRLSCKSGIPIFTSYRACGRWKKHIDGAIVV